MFLNYFDLSNILVILTAILITIVTYLLLSSDISIFSEESSVTNKKIKSENSSENLKKEEKVNNVKESEPKEKKVEMKGFQRNEIKEDNKVFELGNKMDNVEHLSQKINNINNKNDEMGLMFIEGLSSLNSWKNEEVGKEIMEKIRWNLEKRENEEDGVIYQYVYPQNKDNITNINITNNNLASSQESVNSLTETEDGEEEKERQILSSYKLGICKIFEKEKNVKSNIVKEINDKFYKKTVHDSLPKTQDGLKTPWDVCVEPYRSGRYGGVGFIASDDNVVGQIKGDINQLKKKEKFPEFRVTPTIHENKTMTTGYIKGIPFYSVGNKPPTVEELELIKMLKAVFPNIMPIKDKDLEIINKYVPSSDLRSLRNLLPNQYRNKLNNMVLKSCRRVDKSELLQKLLKSLFGK